MEQEQEIKAREHILELVKELDTEALQSVETYLQGMVAVISKKAERKEKTA